MHAKVQTLTLSTFIANPITINLFNAKVLATAAPILALVPVIATVFHIPTLHVLILQNRLIKLILLFIMTFSVKINVYYCILVNVFRTFISLPFLQITFGFQQMVNLSTFRIDIHINEHLIKTNCRIEYE